MTSEDINVVDYSEDPQVRLLKVVNYVRELRRAAMFQEWGRYEFRPESIPVCKLMLIALKACAKDGVVGNDVAVIDGVLCFRRIPFVVKPLRENVQ